MSESKKLEILQNILGDYSRSGSEYLFHCRFCNHHKRKLSINLDKNVAKCWTCDWSTPNLYRVIKRLGNSRQIKEWAELSGKIEITDYDKIFDLDKRETIAAETIKLPEEFQSLCNKEQQLSSLQARRYLRNRGITKEDILFWKIGYCVSGKYENRVVIPSFDLNGRVDYFVGRRYDGGTWSKYKNPEVSKDIIFNQLYVDWDSDVHIVEGVFDAIKAKNSIPLLGSTMKESTNLFKEIVKHDTPVYIALDPDAEKKAEKLITDLLSYDMELYKIDVPKNTDIGEMSHEEFLDIKKSAKLITGRDYFLLNRIMNL